MEKNKQLEEVKKLLEERKLSQALDALQTYLYAYPQPANMDKLEAIRNDFRLMQEYWRKGFKDPQQEQLYNQLLQRAYALNTNLSLQFYLHSSPFLMTLHTSVRQNARNWSMAAIRLEMENFVTNIAMLDLEPHQLREEKRLDLYTKHQKSMSDLFTYIFTSHVWSEAIGDAFSEILLSPTIDENDQQLIVSAVMLSCMNHFDIVKFRVLTQVYRQAQDVRLRQRALIGWVCSLNDGAAKVFPEEHTFVSELLVDEQCVQELIELQLQMILCMETEADRHKIQEEILPEIMKNNQFKITPNGIEEREEDTLEEILHPEASERRMEKLEESLQKMADMHKAGSDIYFGGFAQMKFFDFFKDMSNWFVPFYVQHPYMARWKDNHKVNKIMEKIVPDIPLCNSDKYSFVCGFEQTSRMLTDQMLDMIANGELKPVFVSGHEDQNAAFIRRSYLQDMYRFFKLFPQRNLFVSPFETQRWNMRFIPFFLLDVFRETPLEKHMVEMAATLYKHRMYQEAYDVLRKVSSDVKDMRFFLLMGDLIYYHYIDLKIDKSDTLWLKLALELYENALKLNPSSKRVKNRIARVCFDLCDYQRAMTYFEELMTAETDNIRYQLYKAICLANLHCYDEALSLLYELHFHDENDRSVIGVLANTLTEQEKYEQAEKFYLRLLEEDDVSPKDLLGYAYLLWFQGKIEASIEQLKYYRERFDTSVALELESDRDTLLRHGVSETDMRMMMSLLS